MKMVRASDIYLQEDIEKLLKNRFVVVIGDSIQRAIYKDIVLLIQQNKYLSDGMLRKKGEFSFQNDELIEGGKKGQMINGIGYREVRQYQTDFNLIRFYFVTRCYNNYVESILADLSQDPKPDVIIMNSCLWDISRYGAKGVDEYKKNLDRLFTRFEEVLSKDCLVIWNTTLPISKQARGGFLVPEIEFMNSTLRLDILEANFYAHQIVVSHGFDVLDLHFYLRHQLHRRAGDGIHWDMTAHRRITNLLMTHITEAWDEEFPGRNNRLKKNEESEKEKKKIGQENDYHSPLQNVDEESRSFGFKKEINLLNKEKKSDNGGRKRRRSEDGELECNKDIKPIPTIENRPKLHQEVENEIRQKAFEGAFSSYFLKNTQKHYDVEPVTYQRSVNTGITNNQLIVNTGIADNQLTVNSGIANNQHIVNTGVENNLNIASVNRRAVYPQQNIQYANPSVNVNTYGRAVHLRENTMPQYNFGVQANNYDVGYNSNQYATPQVNGYQWQPYANDSYQAPNRNVGRSHMAVRTYPYNLNINNNNNYSNRFVQMRTPWQIY